MKVIKIWYKIFNQLFCKFYFCKFFILMSIFNNNHWYITDLNENREGEWIKLVIERNKSGMKKKKSDF